MPGHGGGWSNEWRELLGSVHGELSLLQGACVVSLFYLISGVIVPVFSGVFAV